MRRVFTVGVLAVLVVAAGGAQAGTPDSRYVRYAKVRDQVKACVLDRGYRHLGQEKRRTCRRYRARYRLFSFNGSADFFLHCLTSTCPPQPIGVPDPRASIPNEATVYVP